ncbi:MAG: protein-tyrosine-phosphatase [Bacteroidota bacterium]|nr:protein-tyrosine-phosphatase [Bacteroidota bacterium]
MLSEIKTYCDQLIKEFDQIPPLRKEQLGKLTEYVSSRLVLNQEIRLIYVCTHNSRRSHFGQVWGKVAASYYQIENISTYSGGTEATAFHPNAIAALKRVGFRIEPDSEKVNPIYKVVYDDNDPAIKCFSKVYDDPANPTSEFAAIMTCGHAESNCPFIPEVDLRIAITYEDPKAFDNTSQQDSMYDERCRQIALEALYVFSGI